MMNRDGFGTDRFEVYLMCCAGHDEHGCFDMKQESCFQVSNALVHTGFPWRLFLGCLAYRCPFAQVLLVTSCLMKPSNFLKWERIPA
mmetsp:Transcript_12964/g.30724  ORF Transcript_12964/g.30724 Transcript_12964/m.30724 type:complete len:87 (-) Transcript_12964:65-325(-)